MLVILDCRKVLMPGEKCDYYYQLYFVHFFILSFFILFCHLFIQVFFILFFLTAYISTHFNDFILFYFILFYLFYFVLSYFVLFYFTLFHYFSFTSSPDMIYCYNIHNSTVCITSIYTFQLFSFRFPFAWPALHYSFLFLL